MAAQHYPPGPKGLSVLGSLLPFRRDILGFFSECARTYGDFVFIRLGPEKVFLLSHPDLIEQVLVADNRKYAKGKALTANRRLFGNGLLVSLDDFWRRQRKLAAPAFHRERIAEYGRIMAAKSAEHRERWHDGETRDVHTDMMRLTLDIVVETLFGTGLDVEPKEVGEALHLVQEAAEARIRGLLPLPEWVPIPNNLRMGRGVRKLDTIIYDVIKRRRAQGERGPELLSMLLEAQDEDDGSQMTDRQLRDEALTLFLAGHETTALALTFVWYLLAQHPEVERKLHAELDTVLQGRLPTAEDKPRLPYTEWVLLETMRLYPPAWTLSRTPREPVTVGEYLLPKNATLVTSQWIVQRDPRWYDDPETFRPERWDNDLIRRLPRHTYFPFGGGPRLCIGNMFAMMEGVLILATLAQRYSFRLLSDAPLRLQATITLRPRDGLPMHLCRRSLQV